MKSLLAPPVIKHDIEAPGYRDNQLIQIPVRMPPSLGPAWDIIQIIRSLDVERNMPPSLDKCQIPPRIRDLR
jgi:hypothetical protein